MRVRLASFNLESLDDDAGAAPPLERRLAPLRAILDRLDADIFCFQEINATKVDGRRRLVALEKLLEGGPWQDLPMVAAGGAARARLNNKHNLAILSRLPIRSWQSLHHKLVPVPMLVTETGDAPVRANWDRPVLVAAIELPGGRMLHVLNLHLRAPLASFLPGEKDEGGWRGSGSWAEGFFLAAVKRAGQALEARLAVDQLLDADPEALVLVAGDLNSDVLEMPLRLLRAEVADTGNPELAGRVLHLLDENLTEARRFSLLKKGLKLMPDHLLASAALAPHMRGIEILNDRLPDETAPDILTSSHAPLLVEFEL